MTQPAYTFELSDATGQSLTDAGLVDHDGVTLTWQDGTAPDTASFSVPVDSLAAAEILNTETAGEPDREVLLAAYRSSTGLEADRELVFHGAICVDDLKGSSRRLAVVAFSPDEILDQRFTVGQFAPTDCGLLIKQLVDETNTNDGETGIETNASWITTSTTIDIDARQNRPSIQSLRGQWAQMLDGCESWIVPVALAAGKFGRLYAAPRRGAANTDVVFAFGDGTDANCLDMTRGRNTRRVVNDARAYTDQGLAATKTDEVSAAAIRRRLAYESMSGVSDQALLDKRAQGRVDALGTRGAVAEYSCVVDVNAPRLHDEYAIGDTVTLHYRDGAVEFVVERRVRAASVLVTPEGIEIPTSVEVRG